MQRATYTLGLVESPELETGSREHMALARFLTLGCIVRRMAYGGIDQALCKRFVCAPNQKYLCFTLESYTSKMCYPARGWELEMSTDTALCLMRKLILYNVQFTSSLLMRDVTSSTRIVTFLIQRISIILKSHKSWSYTLTVDHQSNV
jgi:hypothetical protein